MVEFKKEYQLHGEGIKSKKVLLESDLNGSKGMRVGRFALRKIQRGLYEVVIGITREVESLFLLSEMVY
jgi:hypothetical protein